MDDIIHTDPRKSAINRRGISLAVTLGALGAGIAGLLFAGDYVVALAAFLGIAILGGLYALGRARLRPREDRDREDRDQDESTPRYVDARRSGTA